MRVNRRLSSALVMVFVLLLSKKAPAVADSNSLMEYSTAVFTTIDFVSNIETIGVAVSGTGLPQTAELSYRRSGESLWHAGHPLMRIDDGRLMGSLFNLLPATAYEIKVLDGSSEINGSASTQPEQLSFTPSVILNVNDDAPPGGDGSAAAPFRTIQEAVNHAGPGTQVFVADGLYREAVTFPNSGTAGNWIQIKAAGNAAILDSADRLSGNIWTAHSTSHVWFKQISGPIAYVARDGKRYYQYDDRTGLMQARGHGGVTMNEGWFYEPSTLRLYVRSRDEPANHTWQIPRLNHAFDLAARDWIWIEGFETRFYGTTTNGCGVCTLNSSHIVIRSNKIHNMQLGIFINWNGTADQGNDTRIEGNEVYDPLVDEWPWTAVKGSFMEGTGIIIRGRAGAIVRDNHVHNFFNGIYTGSSGALENPELAFDADIYNNYIHHISDDGLEPEGACLNHRFRNNTVDRSFVGLSIAPITQGPTWVLHNAFTNFTGRGIKFANNSDGNVLIYHNTGWTSANNINGMDLITSIHNIAMRNNTFQSTGYSFAAARTGSTANDWNHNNWYTTRGSTGPHFKWENINYDTISALCTASGLECDGFENFPGFTNPTGGDFTLLSSSPNIDRGVVIPGINDDFVGNAPDVGAYEFAFEFPPTVLASVRADSNPTHAANVGFAVTFSKLVTGVNNSDFALTTANVTGASITNVMGSGANYTVSVNTGAGNGTIRLDVVDDDSIQDAANNPLGGGGAGNGNFSSGEVYTMITGPTDADVDVHIAGSPMGNYVIRMGGRVTPIYPGINDGPVQVYSTNGMPLITSERAYRGSNFTDWNEMLGLPVEQLTTEYWFPLCDGTGTAQTFISIGNASQTPAEVTVKIAGQLFGNYTIPVGGRVTPDCAGINNGPVQVYSTNGADIIVSERAYRGLNYTDWNEMLGFPVEQLTTEYWFPLCDGTGTAQTFISIGNASQTPAEVTVKIAGQILGNYTIPVGGRVTPDCPGINNGPVQVYSTNGTDLIVSERAYRGANFTDWNEMMGFPADQLTTEYWFPLCDGTGGAQTFVTIGNASQTPAEVTVKIAGQILGNYTIPVGGRVTPDCPGINNGPVQVYSTNGTELIVSERAYRGLNYTDWNEMPGLPVEQLTTEYWFPLYDTTGTAQTFVTIGNASP